MQQQQLHSAHLGAQVLVEVRTVPPAHGHVDCGAAGGGVGTRQEGWVVGSQAF